MGVRFRLGSSVCSSSVMLAVLRHRGVQPIRAQWDRSGSRTIGCRWCLSTGCATDSQGKGYRLGLWLQKLAMLVIEMHLGAPPIRA